MLKKNIDVKQKRIAFYESLCGEVIKDDFTTESDQSLTFVMMKRTAEACIYKNRQPSLKEISEAEKQYPYA